MKTKKYFLLFTLISLLASCSKGVEKTSAKLSLKLSGIVDFSSGIGSGGAILFGKNSAGETFGKKINTTEEDLEIPNGAWVFYALMWSNDSTTMNGKVHCGKSVNQLSGTATTISMSLNNANCTDAEFSGGKAYMASTLNRFADIFIEECDVVGAGTGFSCGKQNQGSALSYRFIFNNYKKTAAGLVFENDSIVSACKLVNGSVIPGNVYNSGLPINFPSGGLGTPFIGSVELFMGSTDCNVNDAKGVQRFPLHQGLGASTAPEFHHVLVSSQSCTPSTPDFVSGTEESKKSKCDQFFGDWNGSTCAGTFLPVNTRFAPAALCASPVASNIAIKHQFMIPKNILCSPYLNKSVPIGSHPFAGGQGTVIRPYKICNEWQLNQIGERNTLSNVYDTAHYKLLNDLDMNKASTLPGIGTYAAPACVGNTGSGVDKYHNLNPLDGHLCGAGIATSEVGFNGVFNGDGHIIANARITGETLSQLGFVRLLGTRDLNGNSGTIKNLQFKNLSVRGLGYIGGVAGDVNGTGLISNVKIDGGEIEARGSNSGGISGNSQGSTFIFEKISANKMKIRGTDYVGGLVGQHTAILRNSMFSGIVTTDHANSTSTYFSGGLVGTNAAGGLISSSFSEGMIGTYTQYIGGIAAKNYGNMTDVYSTMAISSLRNEPGSIMAGGITAYSDGNVTNCFSDTRKMYVGGGTMTYSGTVGSGGSGTVTNCFTDVNNNSVHTTDTYANLRTTSWLTTTFMSAVTTPAAWKIAASNGSIPRLAWEERECLLADNLLSVANQASTLSRGTQLNPIVICTADQFLSMNDRSASEFYRLADSINLSKLGVTGSTADGVSLFNGKLNGGGKALYGLDVNIDSVMDYEVGIFKTISAGAVVSNLNLFGNRVYTSSDTVNYVGLLSNTNNGEISNVKSFGSSVIAGTSVGTFAYRNNGVIRDSNLTGLHLVGVSSLGGVASLNTGSILRVSANVNIGSPSTASLVGAIAGLNGPSGVINQVRANGEINITGSVVQVGGLVGQNTGKIKNALVRDMNMHLGISSSSNSVGGIIGQTSGASSIENVLFTGRIIGTQSSGDLLTKVDVDDTTDERTVGPIVGVRTSGTLMVGALSLNDYLLWGGMPLTISACDPVNNTITMSAPFGNFPGALSTNMTSVLIPFSSSSNIFQIPNVSLLGGCPANGVAVTAYNSYRNYVEHGEVATFSDLSNLSYFTTRGFDMTLDDDARSIAFHLARMNNQPLPANTPVWTMEPGEEFPDLLQLDH